MAASITLTVKVKDSNLAILEKRIKALEKAHVINVTTNASGLENVNTSVKNLDTNVQTTTRSVSDLGTAFVSKIKWGVIQSSIQGVANAFMTALDNIKEVDTQITNVAKVTGKSIQQLQGLRDSAYSTASQYGINAGQYMEAVYEYTKAGFQDNADQMAELSTKAMLVGDTTASVADKFLIAGNAAFGFEGNIERLSLMIDQADYINNNYATTLDNIAEGFPRVASVANMAGMTAEQTMAALGTITATTQETASRASTALRALIMNILGDTTTEIEEGTTATEESISGLRMALERYAPEVVKAADATGKLINPMESLKALADAYNDGILTDQAMTQIEMALGGKLRTNQLDALLKNFSTYEEMLKGMGTAAGTANNEISIMLESWESKAAILENTWTEFVGKFLSSDVFKGLITGLTEVVTLFGNLGNAIATAGGAFAAFKIGKYAKDFSTAASLLSESITVRQTQLGWAVTEKAKLIGQMSGLSRKGLKGSDAYAQLGAEAKALDNEIKSMNRSVVQSQKEYETLSTKAAKMSKISRIITGITVAFTAATMIYNGFREAQDKVIEGHLKEAEESSNKVQTTMTEIDNLKQLHDVYETVKQQYADGKATSEELRSASENLSSALGTEYSSVKDLSAAYEELTNKKKADAIADAEAAVREAKKAYQESQDVMGLPQNLVEFLYNLNAGRSGFANAIRALGFDSQDYVDGFINDTDAEIEAAKEHYKIQKNLVETIDKRAKTSADFYKNLEKNQPELYKRYQDAFKYVEANKETMEAMIAADQQLEEAQNALADATEETAEAIEEQARHYDTLADSVDRAKTATEEFANATKELQGDTFKEYADAYEKFLTDWQNGFKGSTNVKEAENLFFSEKQINQMRLKGVDVGELLASDFMKSFFTYLDENGEQQFTGGEDMGSLAAFAIFDDASGVQLVEGYKRVGNEIRGVNDELIASFEQTFDEQGNESINLMVEDLDALGDALNMDPSFLGAMLEALGTYHPGLEENAEGMIALADSYGALKEAANGGTPTINVENLIQGMGAANASVQEVWDAVDRLKELKNSSEGDDFSLSIDLNADDADQKIAELINQFVIADEQEIEPETNIGEDKPKEAIKNVVEYGNAQKIQPVMDVNLTPAENAINDFVNRERIITVHVQQVGTVSVPETTTVPESKTYWGHASGTKNAPGGLSLVNEGNGPEIIVEDGIARIAGGGKPTLTVLQKGATVFNAEDTRKIFQNSGIPSFAGGTVQGITRWTPPASKGSSTSNSSSSNTSSSADSVSASSHSNPVTSDSSSDDDQHLKNLEAIVELNKSWLKYSEARGEGTERQVHWNKQIAGALLDQIRYMKSTGASQTEINNLYAEYYDTLKAAQEVERDAAEKKVSLLRSQLKVIESQGKPIDKQIAKQEEIKNALTDEIRLLRRQGADEEEINDLLVERIEVRKEIIQLRRQEQEDIVTRRESQLSLLEAEGASVRRQIRKHRQIEDAIKAQIRVLEETGAKQAEINELKEKQLQHEKAIAELEQGLKDSVSEAAQRRIDKINKKRDAALDKLKESYDVQEKTNELEEKQLALEEAKAKLANAQAERTVRVWNAATGRWEWTANAKDVESAQESVKSAADALNEYLRQQKYEADVAAINAKYDKQIEPWQQVIDYIAGPAKSLGAVLKELGNNATTGMKDFINGLNEILKGTGYKVSTKKLYDSGGILEGIGGIKATTENEMVLPPDVTKAILNPTRTSLFNTRMDELRAMFGATTGMQSNSMSNIGKQINGGTFYQYGDVTLTESQAKTTTVYDLAKAARGLKAYVATSR